MREELTASSIGSSAVRTQVCFLLDQDLGTRPRRITDTRYGRREKIREKEEGRNRREERGEGGSDGAARQEKCSPVLQVQTSAEDFIWSLFIDRPSRW